MLKRTPSHVLRKMTYHEAPRATIDFEARSSCDIRKAGGWMYSRDVSTEILCLAYKLPGWKRAKLWHCAHPDLGIEESPAPKELFQWIRTGGLVEAHNAGFEMFMWENVCAKAMGWPEVKREQWRCSAAKSSNCAMPRGLGDLAEALGLGSDKQKDKRGKELIRKYCKPKKLTKGEAELWGKDTVIFNEDVEGLQELWDYCVQDVVTEEACSEALPDLQPAELKLWQITNDMNARGVQIDLDLCKSALRLMAKAKGKLNDELESLTRPKGGAEGDGIEAGTQREAIKTWLAEAESFTIEDTKSKTIEWYLKRGRDLDGRTISAKALRVLAIVKEVNRTSHTKFKRIIGCTDTDGRTRELLVYCGAERTGRFAGRGAQFHNMPKGRFTGPKPSKPKDGASKAAWAYFFKRVAATMEDAVEAVKSEDLAWCECFYGDVMNLITSVIRGVIVAPPGKNLLVADYSSIEARCILWLAGATKALQVFLDDKDIYCDMASGIFGHEVTKSNARVISSTGATERDFGKVAVLGLGYGMGWIKFLITLRTYNIYVTRADVLKAIGEKTLRKYEDIAKRALWPNEFDFADGRKFTIAKRAANKIHRALRDEREDAKECIHELALCKYVVEVYRKRYPEVPLFWKNQNEAAIKAIRAPGEIIKCGLIKWQVVGDYLLCRLPSGRCLHYYKPLVKMARTEWGQVLPSIRFSGRNMVNKFDRQATYGGKVAENITQATARDVLAFAKRRLALNPIYELLVSIHDEIISEVDEDDNPKAGVKEYEMALSDDLPAAYAGCPIAAEGKRLRRYAKG